MQKLFFLTLALLVAALADVRAGDVDFTQCGGDGKALRLTISNCTGDICHMFPNTQYDMVATVIPNLSSPYLHLRVIGFYLGFPFTIVDIRMTNSEVEANRLYQLRFSITPTEDLSGITIPIETNLENFTGALEVCIGFLVRVD